MKNKKLISLICALAMIFSMFSAFTVNAEGEKGISLDSGISKDNKTITINATAVGTTGALSSFGISFEVPEGVTADNVTATSPAGVTLSKGVKDGVLTIAFLDMSGAGVEFADNKLATIAIALPTALTDDYTVTLLGKSSIADTTGEITVDKGMTAATTTVVPSGKPTPKPTSPARPTQAPVVTPNPDEPVVPTDVPATGKGIALDSSLDKTGKVVTINATAVGTTGALSSFGLSFEIPAGVTADNVTATSPAGVTLSKGVKDGVLTIAFLDMSGAGVEFADNKLATIAITLPDALTAPTAFTLLGKSSIADTTGEITVDKGMTATSTVVSPSSDPVKTPAPVQTVALKDNVGAGATDAVAAAKTEGKDVYITVELKKGDQPAVYGEDYVAVYGGKNLTQGEFSDLISGYTDEDMADVINGLQFKIFNSAVNKISTTVNSVNADGTNPEQIVDPVVDKSLGKVKPTATPKAPVVNVAVTVAGKSTKTVTTGGIVTLKSSVDDKYKVDGGKFVYTIEKDTVLEALTLSDETATAKFEALKRGSSKVTVDYVDEDGKVIATGTVTITVASPSSPSGPSSDSDDESSGMNGPIARPDDGVNGEYFGQFSDLGNVQWAWEAINTLADKNIVSGRGDGIFDPDANITRAEYCQILIGAIEKTAEYADASFDDVPTDAWFYHAVAVASKYGIVSGYGDGNFGPYDLITRQDMALMTYKAAQVMNVNLTAQQSADFTDAAEVSDYAAEAVNTLYSAGIINGMGDGTFAPRNNATRAQASVIIYQTFVK